VRHEASAPAGRPASAEALRELGFRACRDGLDARLWLDVAPPKGGSSSDPDTPLRDTIEAFLADHDPDARLIPALGYGYSDCHVLREAYGSIAYGFIPFRYGDAMTNLKTKHGADERILLDDLCFQVQAAHTIARELQ
jgi:hypothetical protein